MNALPNIISASRGIAALAMLFFPVFSPWFWALYCWGGISDMIDGPLARKLGAVSEVGSRIDSVADLVFVIGSSRQRKLAIPHSVSNRLTGILLFCLPFALIRFDALIPTVIVCISGTASLFEDFQFIRKGKIQNQTSG